MVRARPGHGQEKAKSRRSPGELPMGRPVRKVRYGRLGRQIECLAIPSAVSPLRAPKVATHESAPSAGRFAAGGAGGADRRRPDTPGVEPPAETGSPLA